VLLNSTLNSKLLVDDITPRRLCRIFRFQIREYIHQSGNTSYLYNKYATGIDIKPYCCFPGAENMVNDSDFKLLIKVYEALDKRLNTKITERIVRVYRARSNKIV